MSEVIIKVDRLHLWMVSSFGAILLLIFAGVQTLDIWNMQRNAEGDSQVRRRLAILEGQMDAVLESLQHDDN